MPDASRSTSSTSKTSSPRASGSPQSTRPTSPPSAPSPCQSPVPSLENFDFGLFFSRFPLTSRVARYLNDLDMTSLMQSIEVALTPLKDVPCYCRGEALRTRARVLGELADLEEAFEEVQKHGLDVAQLREDIGLTKKRLELCAAEDEQWSRPPTRPSSPAQSDKSSGSRRPRAIEPLTAIQPSAALPQSRLPVDRTQPAGLPPRTSVSSTSYRPHVVSAATRTPHQPRQRTISTSSSSSCSSDSDSDHSATSSAHSGSSWLSSPNTPDMPVYDHMIGNAHAHDYYRHDQRHDIQSQNTQNYYPSTIDYDHHHPASIASPSAMPSRMRQMSAPLPFLPPAKAIHFQTPIPLPMPLPMPMARHMNVSISAHVYHPIQPSHFPAAAWIPRPNLSGVVYR